MKKKGGPISIPLYLPKEHEGWATEVNDALWEGMDGDRRQFLVTRMVIAASIELLVPIPKV
jgi:hypothetical protein